MEAAGSPCRLFARPEPVAQKIAWQAKGLKWSTLLATCFWLDHHFLGPRGTAGSPSWNEGGRRWQFLYR